MTTTKTIRKAPELRRQSLDYDTNAAGDESGISCPEPTLAQQQFAEESDINFIADRYGLTGEMPTVAQLPSFGDFTGIFDFQSAQNQVIEAQRQFMTLPAKVRAHFRNDPQRLIEFLESTDPDDRKMAEALGLVKPRTETRHDAPQSRQGDAGANGKGEDTLSSTTEPEAPAKPPKKGGKDT